MWRQLFRFASSAAVGLVWLTGCNTTNPSAGALSLQASAGASDGADPLTTSSIGSQASAALPAGGAGEALLRAKRHFRAGEFAHAEEHYARALQADANDAEAWLGLAACYDRQKRFDKADQAYAQAIRLAGSTPEILNNQGYSYMLRGDLNAARHSLVAAKALDPKNRRVNANLALLQASLKMAKGQ